MLVRRSAPPGLVVPLGEVKAALRVLHADDDARLTALIRAEGARYEAWSGRLLQPTDLSLFLEGWRAPAGLPARPVRAVAAVAYLDAGHAWQALPAPSWRAVRLPRDGTWGVAWEPAAVLPALSDRENPVRIDFAAGYDLPGATGGDPELASRFEDQEAVIHMVAAAFERGAPVEPADLRRLFGYRRVLA